MARGGRRQGRVGQSYANRTDLNPGPRPLPAAAATGQPYGAAGQQLAAQQAIPMASGPVVSPSPTPAPAAAPSGGMPPGPLPGSLPPLNRPSERPGEPLTTGAPVGAGPGPEILGLAPSPQTLGDMLNRLAASNPDIAYLAAAAQAGNR